MGGSGTTQKNRRESENVAREGEGIEETMASELRSTLKLMTELCSREASLRLQRRSSVQCPLAGVFNSFCFAT